MKQYILAHDVGTSGNKAVICDENGEILFSCSRSYETAYPNPSWVEQDPELWWKAVCESTREILAASDIPAGQIAAVSFSGIMNSCLPIDRNLRALRPAMIWADKRSTAQAGEIEAVIGLREAYRISGHRIDPSYVISKIMWVRDNEPEIYRRTAAFVQAKDYLVARLTGRVVTDYSDASHLGCFDLQTKSWSKQMLAALRIDPGKFPEVLTSTDAAGTVTRQAAGDIGLPEGLPVVIGGGDGACATAGAGVTEAGEAYTNLGTSAWIGMLSNEPLYSEQYITFNFVYLDGKSYMPLGTMQSAGHSFEWAIRQFFTPQERGRESFYAELSARLEEVDPANRLLYLPYLMGERSPWWNSEARGCFIGLDTLSDTYQMTKAVVEGVACNLRIILESMRGTLSKDELTVIGGLARNSAWVRTLSDVFGMDLRINRYVTEGTSIGALLCGGIGAGIFSDFSQASRMNPAKSVHRSDTSRREIYDRKYELFRESYTALLDVFAGLKQVL